jgi:hypothetical protein
MKIDHSEPIQIEALIKQSSPESFRVPLNAHGFADYAWQDYYGRTEHAERKAVEQLLSDFDEAERDLRKYRDNAPHLMLIVEGVVEPMSGGGIRTFALSQDGRYYRPRRDFKTNWERLEGWLIGMEEAGITVWRTSSWQHTARSLVLWERHALSPEHSTLQRYLKPSVRFNPDPQVESLMGLQNARIGPETAKKLIEVFGTMWDVLRQEPQALADLTPGVGLQSAKRILKSAGRKDI